MLAGIQIILERMKTNPEDFTYSMDRVTTKWSRLLDHALSSEMLTQDERDAVQEGLRNVRREIFNQRVMQTLTGEDNQEGETLTLSNTSQASVTLSGGLTQLSSSQVANGAYMNPAQNITASNQMGLSGLFGGIFK